MVKMVIGLKIISIYIYMCVCIFKFPLNQKTRDNLEQTKRSFQFQRHVSNETLSIISLKWNRTASRWGINATVIYHHVY